MSTVVFVGQQVPDKGLKKITKYKAYLSPEEKVKILEEIFPDQVPDNVDVHMHVEIEVKEYSDPDRVNKNRQYDGIG